MACIVQPTFTDMFHIHPSMDECWINEMYMYVCMYVCIVTYQGSSVTQQLNGASLLYSLISATMSTSVPHKNETNVTKALLRK
jgi:hypothetical protein